MNSRRQLPMKTLVLYMISALLFLTVIEVHIHNSIGAATADHGFAVSISSLDTALLPTGSSDEIKVSPDGMLKAKQNIVSLNAVFWPVVILLIILTQAIIGRLREDPIHYPEILFHRSPPLRAPPL